MQVPWFFATTPAPTPAVRRTERRSPWWARLGQRYVAWAERSHEQLRQQTPAGR
jgi:hypothetical protein